MTDEKVTTGDAGDKRPAPEWKDATSYRHGERGVIVPTSWSVTSGRIRLVVTCAHRDYPGEWIMHGYGLGIDADPLGLDATEPANKAMEEAERVALLAVKRSERSVRAIFDARREKP